MRHIETVTCEGCGKVFTSSIKNARFCGRACANRNYETKKYKGRAKVDKSKYPRCPNNKWVVCHDQTNDKEEIFENCTVQVLTNTVTGDVSVGWWKNEED